jgi:hypothetical protein
MGLLFNYGVNQNWSQWVEDNGAAAIVRLAEGRLKPENAPAPKTQFRADGVNWQAPAETDPDPAVGPAPAPAPAP